MSPAAIPSKLPHVGTTIFTEMSALAQEYQAINLSQGFPDFPISQQLVELVGRYMQQGYNQYAPMPGVPALRQRIADKLNSYSSHDFDPEVEITVTSGATEGLFVALQTLVHPGDEVIIFDPAYDLYAPSVVLAGGIPVHIELTYPEFAIDWDQLNAAINSGTKVIVINNPNNPAGSVMPREDLEQLAEIVNEHQLHIISDEVYEHMVFDGLQHHSILSLSKLRERGVAVFSFGKTLHATGWKIGYCVAPPEITVELKKIHQFTTFSINTPIQHAIADYIQDPETYNQLGGFFQQKRDLFLNTMSESAFKPLPSHGTYFQMMEYGELSDLPDREMANWLTREHGVASIPVSVFYQRGTDHKVLRFCFAKSDETLIKAAEKLCRI